jgi:YVTN family beta-propeller protein
MSCKEKPDPEPEVLVQNGLLVLNEGNFQSGNATMSFVDANGTVHLDVFHSLTGLPLGDVAHSLMLHAGDLWVVVNNSGRIFRLGLPNLNPICTVNGLRSPRFLLPISGSKAYATDLYSNEISIIDLETCTVHGRITTGAWTEEMVVVGSKCYVTQTGTNQLLIIDTATDQLKDSLSLGVGPVSLRADRNGKLWVLCDGGLGNDSSGLFRVDPQADTVERSFIFPNLSAFPSDLRIDPSGTWLYWLDGGIARMHIQDTVLPTQAWFSAGGMNFYALDVDPNSGNLWVADAKDFVQKGKVMVVSPQGNQVASYVVGVNPGAMLQLP